MDFHRHDHRKKDGRSLYRSSREQRDYQVTTDVEGPYAPIPHLRWHPLRREWVAYNARNTRTLNPPKDFNPLAPVQPDGFPGEIPVTDFEVAVFENRWLGWPCTQLVWETMIARRPRLPAGRGVFDAGRRFAARPVGGSHRAAAASVGGSLPALSSLPEVQYVLPFESRGDSGAPAPPARTDLRLPLPAAHDRATGAGADGEPGADPAGPRPDPALVLEDREHSVTLCPEYGRYPYECWILLGSGNSAG